MIEETLNEEQENEDDVVDYLTILDVDDYQFFVDEHGRLCQKIEDYSFNIIADENGFPLTEDTQIMYEDEPITRIINNDIRFVIDEDDNLTITN